MASAGISGIASTVAVGGANQGSMKGWSAELSSETGQTSNSASDASVMNLKGHAQWAGSYNLDITPAVIPGASGTFIGAMNASLGLEGTVIITSVNGRAAARDSSVITYVVNFVGDGGPPTVGAVTPVADSSLSQALSSINIDVLTGTDIDGTLSSVGNVEEWEFTIQVSTTDVKNTGTSGWVQRFAGPITANGSWTYDPTALTGVPTQGDLLRLSYSVNAADDSWDFDWARVTGVNWDVNRETGEVISITVSWEFHGYANATNDDEVEPDTQGSITSPTPTTFWD